MSLPQVDGDALVAEVRRLAAESPDFVYQNQKVADSTGCLYVHVQEDGSKVAGCLIGQALANLGVPLDVLHGFDTGPGDAGANEVLPTLGVSLEVTQWASVAQVSQDSADRWSQAVAYADREVDLNGV